MLSKIRTHRLENLRQYGRCGVIVQVDTLHREPRFYSNLLEVGLRSATRGRGFQTVDFKFDPERCICNLQSTIRNLISLSLVDRRVFLRVFRPQVFSSRTNEAVVVKLLDDVGRPSAHARNGKYRREQVHIDTECVISRS